MPRSTATTKLVASLVLISTLLGCNRPTPVPAASPLPVNDQPAVLFQDDFSDPASGWKSTWFEGSGAAHGEEYRDGEYRIWVDNDQSHYALSMATPGKTFSDLSLEVDVRRVSGAEGASAYLMCRADRQTTSFYYFALDSRGIAVIGVYLAGEEQHSVSQILPDGLIKPDVNHVRADCVGSKLSLYANGQFALDTQEAGFKEGDVGLGAGGASQGTTDMYFDNFTVYPPGAAVSDLAQAGTPTTSPSSVSTVGDEEDGLDISSPDAALAPPSSLFDLVMDKAAAGDGSLEDGLIAGLRVFAGEADLASVAGSISPSRAEGTGLINEALWYMAHGPDAGAKTEMKRLLGLIAPTPDQLLSASKREATSSLRPPGLARTTLSAAECSKLWEEGFPKDSNLICFEYKEQNLGSYKGRIFYPAWWTSADPQWPYLQAASEAVADAWKTYSNLGAMQAVDIVFTVLEIPTADALAIESSESGGVQSCQIIAYPAAIAEDKKFPSAVLPFGAFKQVIAHEVFHCFQVWNFPDKMEPNGDWSVQDWWGESTADYFSNIVYPAVNYEWVGNTNAFDKLSGKLPMFKISYPNFEFFQFLANTIGDAGILALIQQLPATGTELDQQAALAGYPNIEQLYHEFGREYLDGKIIDTSGKPIPRQIATNGSDLFVDLGITPDQTVKLGTSPFVLARRIVQYKPDHRYAVETTIQGVPGEVAVRVAAKNTDWGDPPSRVIAACDPPGYLTLFTSTDPTNDVYQVSIHATVEEDIVCDKCLQGHWELDKDSFKSYMATPFQGTDGLFEMKEVQGSWTYSFTKKAELNANYNFAFEYSLNQTALSQPLETDVLVTVDGPAGGVYWVPEQNTLMVESIYTNFTMEQTVGINGQEVGGGPIDLFSPFPAQGSSSKSTYTCLGDTLTLAWDAPTATGLPAIQYARVPSGP